MNACKYPSSRPPNAFAELAAAYSGWHHFITTLSYVESKEPVIVTGAYVLSWSDISFMLLASICKRPRPR
ncbi:hypothetical protein CsSME_00031833 [Camellia sinensis var. sinensis]